MRLATLDAATRVLDSTFPFSLYMGGLWHARGGFTHSPTPIYPICHPCQHLAQNPSLLAVSVHERLLHCFILNGFFFGPVCRSFRNVYFYHNLCFQAR